MWKYLRPRPDVMNSRAITAAVDVGIVLFCILVALNMYVGSGESEPAMTAHAPLVQPGRSLSLPGVDWTRASRHVILLVSPSCPTSLHNAPLYSEVSRQAEANAGVRFVALAAESPDEVRKWLKVARVESSDVIQFVDLISLGFFTVPTVLLLDQDGVVTDLLAGAAELADVDRFIIRMLNPAGGQAVNNAVAAIEISEEELRVLRSHSPLSILDVRKRDDFEKSHRPHCINIPDDEIAVRARLELQPSLPVVVDCLEGDLRRCRYAGMVLTSLGFSAVYVLLPPWEPT
jgi:rhodanese-related sulfurtransferase